MGIGVCLAVGLFSLVALVGLTLFLPREFWASHALARFLRPFRFHPPTAGGEAAASAGEDHPLAYLRERLCGLAFAYVLAININSLSFHPLARLAPENWRPLAIGLGLRQRWGMFEDVPSKDGWFIVRGKQVDGSEIDVLRDGAKIDWNRPDWPPGVYPNQNWQKLFREMAYDDELGYQVFRLPVATYLYRTWNARHPAEKQLIELDFIYCMEVRDANTGEKKVYREQLVFVPPRPV
jgi:hypothetical protein